MRAWWTGGGCKLAPMPDRASFAEAAGLVIGAGTAYEGLVDRGRLQAGQTVLITAAAGGVGSAAVQIAAAVGARPLGVASPDNHDYVRSLGASEVFDYHAADWVQQVRAAVPGGVDLLFDAAGGQTRDQAIGAVRDGGRAIFIVLQGPPAELERGITGESFAATISRQLLEAVGRLVDTGGLRPQVETVLPLDKSREALAQVAGRFDDTGDFLARDERQGNPREAAAEEPDVPRADTRAIDPHQYLSRRRYWVWQLTQLYAANPAQLLRQRCSHGSSLLTVYSSRPPQSSPGHIALADSR